MKLWMKFFRFFFIFPGPHSHHTSTVFLIHSDFISLLAPSSSTLCMFFSFSFCFSFIDRADRSPRLKYHRRLGLGSFKTRQIIGRLPWNATNDGRHGGDEKSSRSSGEWHCGVKLIDSWNIIQQIVVAQTFFCLSALLCVRAAPAEPHLFRHDRTDDESRSGIKKI